MQRTPNSDTNSPSPSVPRILLRASQPQHPVQQPPLQSSTPSPAPTRSTTPPQYPPGTSGEGDIEEALLDAFLLQALNNPRDRLTLLKLDYELERFMNSSRQRLDFPPLPSYQRMLVHRVAQYFKLQHTSLESEDGNKRVIVVFKGPESRVPDLRFSDLLEQPEPEPVAKNVKIMRRPASDSQRRQESTKDGRSEETGARRDGGLTESERKTIEEREEEYARARARIFNQDSNGDSKDKDQPKEKQLDREKRVDNDEVEAEKEKQLIREKTNPTSRTRERRVSATAFDISAEPFGRPSEGWDSRYSPQWSRPVDPTWPGAPPADPTYWDAGMGYDTGMAIPEYYSEYYDPSVIPMPTGIIGNILPQGRAWPEQSAQPPRYLYAPEHGAYVRAPSNFQPPPPPMHVSQHGTGSLPYAPQGSGNYVRSTHNYGQSAESFVNIEPSIPGEQDMSRGMAQEDPVGAGQPWSSYTASPTYVVPKQTQYTRNNPKVQNPPRHVPLQHIQTQVSAPSQQHQPQPLPQQTRPNQPQGGNKTPPMPKFQQPRQHQQKQRSQSQPTLMQQPPPRQAPQRTYTSPTEVHHYDQTSSTAVYAPNSNYGAYSGYYAEPSQLQSQMPSSPNAGVHWQYYPPSAPVQNAGPYMAPPHSLVAMPAHHVPSSPSTGDMLQQGVIDPPYGVPQGGYQPSYQPHRYSMMAGRATYLGEYERPPPKSKELFDPSSPSSPGRQYQNHMAQTLPPQYFPTQPVSPSQQSQLPTSSATSRSAQEEGVTTSIEAGPSLNTPFNATPDADTQKQPTAAKTSPPQNPSSLLVPNRGVKIMKPGATFYDYSPKALYTPEASSAPLAQACPPMAVNHILEVYDLRSCEDSATDNNKTTTNKAKTKELTEEQLKWLDLLKGAGASIKQLSTGPILAIFKTASAAKHALENVQSPYFKLRRWTTPTTTATPVSPSEEKTEQRQILSGISSSSLSSTESEEK